MRLKLFSSGDVVALRRAAHPRAPGRQGRRTSARTRSRPPTENRPGSTTSACRPTPRISSGCAISCTTRSSACGAARSRTTASTAWSSSHPDRPRGVDHPAVAKYLRQAGLGFSDAYIERTVTGHPDIARLLIELFEARLDPGRADHEISDRIATEIEEALDAVPSLDEDRILRRFLNLVQRDRCAPTTSRTDADGGPHPYLSFKLDSARDRRPAAAPAAVRDLRLLAARRGRAPARRQGGARRHPLVGPARGLPHRDPGPDEGADGEERRHRAGRLEGRLRRQAPAERRRPRGAAGRRRSPATRRSCAACST